MAKNHSHKKHQSPVTQAHQAHQLSQVNADKFYIFARNVSGSRVPGSQTLQVAAPYQYFCGQSSLEHLESC